MSETVELAMIVAALKERMGGNPRRRLRSPVADSRQAASAHKPTSALSRRRAALLVVHDAEQQWRDEGAREL